MFYICVHFLKAMTPTVTRRGVSVYNGAAPPHGTALKSCSHVWTFLHISAFPQDELLEMELLDQLKHIILWLLIQFAKSSSLPPAKVCVWCVSVYVVCVVCVSCVCGMWGVCVCLVCGMCVCVSTCLCVVCVRLSMWCVSVYAVCVCVCVCVCVVCVLSNGT